MLTRYREPSVGAGQEAGVLPPPDFGPGPLHDQFSHAETDPSAEFPPLPVVRLKGVELHAITERQTVEHILRSIEEGIGGTVVTPNLDILRRCAKDLNFAALVSEAELVVPDGMPLLWASRLQGTPLPQRVAGSDLISSLTVAAAAQNRSIFLLGGTPGSAEGAARILQERSPGLRVAGTYCPPVGFEEKPEEMSRLIESLTSTKPDIVWVALGSPKQEYLINRIRRVLPASWWLGVGISFSFLTGEVKRAPRWIQKLGLEWFHRMVQEPRRLFRRYVVHGVPFAASLMYSAAVNRFSGMQEEQTTGHRHRGLRGRKPRNGTRLLDDSSMLGVALDSPQAKETIDSRDQSIEEITEAPMIMSRNSDSALGKGLKRLKAIILLGGKVRQSPLSVAIGRSLLDLPLDDTGSILNHWVSQSAELARSSNLEDLHVRVMDDHKATEPKSIDARFASMVRVQRDRSSFRGTGGLIADIAKDYADDDLILVGNAAQVLLDPLWAIAAALDHKTGDFTLISHRDGTASGLMLLACKTVRAISEVGYIDLKEQALPTIAKRHDVRVVHCRQPTGLPLFSLSDYISALQRHHYRREHRRARTNPLTEDFSKRFAIVEDGATVAPDAYLHDAVVLRGATVESGAAAIRSLVCPSAVLRRGRQVSDQLIGDC
jgi:N-acetylglucosaminyldiphosphoundecaprenol N-acetyl-beta-D-mannosaminyltransferase